MDLTEDQVLEAAPPPPARKLSRLRKAGTTPKGAPFSPLDENAQPNGNDAQLPTPVVASPSTRPQEDAAEQGKGDTASEQVSGARETEGGDGYWDEEDELEDYLENRSAPAREAPSHQATDCEDEPRPSHSHGASDDEEGSMGLGDVNADTQRVLRETASRDRLGQASTEVEIKPISSILDKIKQRQQAAIDRAAKPSLISAPSFEEVFAAALGGKGAGSAPAAPATNTCPSSDGAARPAAEGPAVSEAVVGSEGHAASPPKEQQTTDAPAQASPQWQQQADGPDSWQEQQHTAAQGGALLAGVAADVASDDDDLEIVSQGSGGDEDANVVELPSTRKKKPSQLSFFSQWEPSYEEEALIDDGYDSEEEELPKEEEEGSAASEPSRSEAEEAGSGEEEGGSDDEQQSAELNNNASQIESEEYGGSQPGEKGGTQATDGSPATGAAAGEDLDDDMEDADTADAAGAAPLEERPAAERQIKKRAKLPRMFLDMEAELSDDEQGSQHSDDEEDDDVDDQGELADLIGAAKETGTDWRKRDELHRQWAEQRDAKELQQVLKGLKQGFRRRHRTGFMDDEDDEEGGRRRRARLEDEDEDGIPMDDGGVAWFQDAAGSDEDAEDLELLKRAQQQHALGESRQDFDHPSSIPLDQDSQDVLSLLARSASEPQVPQLPTRSRYAPAGLMLGSEPTGGASRLGRGTSFVGRQTSVQRLHSGSMAGVGAKSFVFGREDSNSALAADKAQPGGSDSQAPTGPTNFANLRQLTGMAAGGSRGGKVGGGTLVSRLAAPKHRPGKEPAGSQGAGSSSSVDAANAVFQHVVLGKK